MALSHWLVAFRVPHDLAGHHCTGRQPALMISSRHPSLLPRLEHQYSPKGKAPILRPSKMFLPARRDERRVEDAISSQFVRVEKGLCPFAQLTSEPSMN